MDYVILALLVLVAVLAVLNLVKKPKEKRDERLDMLNSNIHTLSQNVNDKLVEVTRTSYENSEKLTRVIGDKLDVIRVANAQQSDAVTKKVNDAVQSLQQSNEKKLDEMRKTVDEKLTETLNSRISASFKTVSEQLENVYKSLGEMQKLSSGVTDNVKDLSRILTNVKARGTWAEVQLENILNETIPQMFDKNVRTNPRYNGMVEFAVRIPDADGNGVTYLPIDSKFPMEDYARLSAAAQSGDLAALEAAKKALENRVKDEAKLVRQYIAPPHTTPFAILYLATEGLYAEIMSSQNGVAEKLQAQGIMLAGPSTVTALLNSLAMGFRTIAINQKANEVWKVLGAAKTQYAKFGDLIAKARRKVDEAGRVLEDADKRNSIIQKNLKNVETLEPGESNSVLGIEDGADL
ncbi:MAG TPA: DNA recombination protein RmuC [Candidatus Scubalenecus merdavium]|uniref:DNA recombination protein RmuC n=1 Tax=Candidatus Scybalenecus merdavium TaxID=2840939 RepID=A0A9D1MTJ5_9FIRM|nr:DNA recombination protein RmuC [Candidatus Scubalenecus merdavium]